jgi:DNA polymerase III subunit epsilon
MSRSEAAEIAASLGCEVDANVTKKTTTLVVGDQDIEKLAGHEKSRKHRRAEELISDGQRIRILGETDFNELARMLRRNT